jgi:chromosome segregation ATPase
MTPEREQWIRDFYLPSLALISAERLERFPGYQYGRLLLAEIDTLRADLAAVTQQYETHDNLWAEKLEAKEERIDALEKELAVSKRDVGDCAKSHLRETARYEASERRAERLREALTQIIAGLRGEDEDFGSRVVEIAEAALAGEPTLSQGGEV